MNALLAVVVVFVVLVISEVLWRKKIVRGEAGRKLVHISVGSFVAFWPYLMSWREIQLISLAFLVVVIISQYAHVFHAVHGVKRKTWGEAFFALGIGVSALIAPSKLVFTAAILHLALADGFAALVGKKYGLLHEYKVGNYSKTLAGTLTFWAISTIIVVATFLIGGSELQWPIAAMLVLLPLIAALIENIAIMGLDNILVPLLVIAVLSSINF